MSEIIAAPLLKSLETSVERSQAPTKWQRCQKQAQIYGQLLSERPLGRPWSSSQPDFYQLARLIELGLVPRKR